MKKLSLKKIKAGESVPVAVDSGGYAHCAAPSDGVYVTVGFGGAFIEWSEIDRFRASSENERDIEVGRYFKDDQEASK